MLNSADTLWQSIGAEEVGLKDGVASTRPLGLEGLDGDAGGGLDPQGDRRDDLREAGHRLPEDVQVVGGRALHDERGHGSEGGDVGGVAADRHVRRRDAERDGVEGRRVVPVPAHPLLEGVRDDDVPAAENRGPAGGGAVGLARGHDGVEHRGRGRVDEEHLARERVSDGHHHVAVVGDRHAQGRLGILERDDVASARGVAGHEVDREDLHDPAAEGAALALACDGVVAALGDHHVAVRATGREHDVGGRAVLAHQGLAVRLGGVELAVAEEGVVLEAVAGQHVEAGALDVADAADGAGADAEGLEHGVLAVAVLLGDGHAVRRIVDRDGHVLAAGDVPVRGGRAAAVAAEAEVRDGADLEGRAVGRDGVALLHLVVGVAAGRHDPLVHVGNGGAARRTRITLGPGHAGVALGSLGPGHAVEAVVALGARRSRRPWGASRALLAAVAVGAGVALEGVPITGAAEQREHEAKESVLHLAFSCFWTLILAPGTLREAFGLVVKDRCCLRALS